MLDAALRVVDEHGFGAFSIEAVAREARLAKTVVYASFDGQQDLLRALVDRELDHAFADIVAAIPRPPYDDPGEVLRRALMGVLEAARERPETWRLFVLPADGMPPAARANVERNHSRLLLQLEPLVAWGMDRLDLGELDAELATHTLVAGAEQAIRMTLTDPEHFTPERIVEFVSALLAAYVDAREGTPRTKVR